jgi:hypothetical protein
MIRFYCCFYQGVKNNFGKSEIGETGFGYQPISWAQYCFRPPVALE